jgi:hypothetical protein
MNRKTHDNNAKILAELSHELTEIRLLMAKSLGAMGALPDRWRVQNAYNMIVAVSRSVSRPEAEASAACWDVIATLRGAFRGLGDSSKEFSIAVESEAFWPRMSALYKRCEELASSGNRVKD